MRISIAGTEKINLKGLLGANSVNIKAVTGDFHFVEMTSDIDDNFIVRNSESTIGIISIRAQDGETLTIKMLNSTLARIRPKEHLMVKDPLSNTVGFLQFASAMMISPVYSDVTFYFEASNPYESVSGLYMQGTLSTSHSIFLLEDSLLEEGESLEYVSSFNYKYLYMEGNGVIEISPLKKKD
jgi:hypothetical protein